jgi:hypothetical protein
VRPDSVINECDKGVQLAVLYEQSARDNISRFSVCGNYPGGNRGCEARQILLYLAAVKCRGRYSLSDISEQLGPLTISGLDSVRTKIMVGLQYDKRLRQQVAEIESILDDKSKSED